MKRLHGRIVIAALVLFAEAFASDDVGASVSFARQDGKTTALQDGNRDIYAEIDHEREKLFILTSAKYRPPVFQGVSIPVMNAGREVSSALQLFRKAWVTVDGMIESEVVDPLANNVSMHKDAVREHLIGNDCRFSVYDVAKRWGATLEEMDFSLLPYFAQHVRVTRL